ncbi:MAG: chemotaxis protein CheB [Rhodospirillaceae bacterium]|nr:chemotaxis protein CheB [Rhodospirillaceae bacterium]
MTSPPEHHATTVVIGASAGGLSAIGAVLSCLPRDYELAVIIVQHIPANAGDTLLRRFQRDCCLPVEEAEDKAPIKFGTVFVAPPDHHLMVEHNRHFSLSREERVNFSRPAIDILFETAAETFCTELVGVILTGASADGAVGLAKIHTMGGTSVVQSPETAEVDIMPRAALAACAVDHILPLAEIGPFLACLHPGPEASCKPIF